MRPFLFLLFLSAAFLPAVAGQSKSRGTNGSSFTVKVDRTEVMLGEAIEVTFNVEQSDGSSFTPPDWAAAGLTVVSTSQSSNMSISGNRVRSSNTFRYWVMPLESGKAAIPPATLRTADGELKTESIDITVKPAADGSRSLSPNTQRKKPKIDLPTIRI